MLHIEMSEVWVNWKGKLNVEIRTQNYRKAYIHRSVTLLNPENLLLNMEKKDWKARLRQLGLAGILFFTVKGILTLTLGGWLLSKLGCGE